MYTNAVPPRAPLQRVDMVLICRFYGEGGTADDPRPECKACPPHFVGSLVAGTDNITDCGGCVPGDFATVKTCWGMFQVYN
jgi:hypothetical protein